MGRKNTEADFWNRVDMSGGVSDCWLWTGPVNHGGYGKTHFNGKEWRANRLSYFLTRGEMPNLALHRCDTPTCCNPGHIYSGTNQDNDKDRVDRGRSFRPRGILHSQNKYSNEDILKIREMASEGVSNSEIGKVFKMGATYVYQIVTRKRWTHI